MILSQSELRVLSPALALLHTSDDFCIDIKIEVPGGRVIYIELSTAGIYVKAKYPDSPPAAEFYQKPMGLAQAYGVKKLEIMFSGA